VNDARFRREAGVAIDNFAAVEALRTEVPWYRYRARRARQSEIESALSDDPDTLRDYRERRRELSAWNDLETVAALVFGIAVFQFVSLFLE
jgi:hypothetical protein